MLDESFEQPLASTTNASSPLFSDTSLADEVLLSAGIDSSQRSSSVLNRSGCGRLKIIPSCPGIRAIVLQNHKYPTRTTIELSRPISKLALTRPIMEFRLSLPHLQLRQYHECYICVLQLPILLEVLPHTRCGKLIHCQLL